MLADKDMFDGGYKYKVEAKCPVLDFETKAEKEVILACSPEHFAPNFEDKSTFDLHTAFGEAGTMSCGFIHVKKGGCKPNKNSGKHALVPSLPDISRHFTLFLGNSKWSCTSHPSSFMLDASSLSRGEINMKSEMPARTKRRASSSVIAKFKIKPSRLL